MLNTTPKTASKGALHDTTQPDFGNLFGEFARFMQKEQYNAIEPMKNHIEEPLECISITTIAPSAKGVTVTTEKKPNGSYRTVAYVHGKFYASAECRDKQGNIEYIRKALAEGGYTMPEHPKVLAPVMSARMPRKSNRKAA